jgi:hypothetical protein
MTTCTNIGIQRKLVRRENDKPKRRIECESANEKHPTTKAK